MTAPVGPIDTIQRDGAAPVPLWVVQFDKNGRRVNIIGAA